MSKTEKARSKKSLIGALVVAMLMVTAGVSHAAGITLRGAGATFPAPLYFAWIERFQKDHPGDFLTYESVGSGAGIARFSEGELDFAASDVPAPTTGDERSDTIGAQFPVTAGMLTIAYNLPGVGPRLKLPRSVYVDIFLGKIRKWDDPRIAAANPGVPLPARDILVTARLDSSGTTFAFTSHLSTISADWAESIGVGKKVTWPAFVTLANGNEGVTAKVKSVEGSLGYIEYGIAVRAGLQMAALENKEGKFVAPSPESGSAGFNQSSYLGLERLKSSVLDPSGPGAYPIVSYSWLILRWDYSADKLRLVNAFVDYVLGEGQKLAPSIGYLPLPAPVVYRGKAVVARIYPSEGAEGALANASSLAAPQKAAPPAEAVTPPALAQPAVAQRALAPSAQAKPRDAMRASVATPTPASKGAARP